MKARWLWVVITLAVALAGCASAPPVDPKDETVSVVFGYFDMKNAPSSLAWVSLKHYDGNAKGERYTMAVRDGLFFHVGIGPGSYQVDKFGGTGGIPFLTRRPFEYDFGGKGRNDTAVRIKKPGLYFLGSYKYIDHAGGFFEPDKFEMQPGSEPTEKQLLERLVKELQSDKELTQYSRQIQVVKRRLAEL